MIGIKINKRIVLESELGRGGMGVVYRGRDLLLERPVAVKVVGPGQLGAEGQARLLREAQAAASLNHPNIVAVYDAGEVVLPEQDGPATFVVMELVAGQTLRDVRPADVTESMAILEQICAALAAAHAQGIIHRDLKPENVIRSDDGLVKLMDFGLARTSGRTRLTQEGTFLGTFDYLAPEIIQGQAASAQSDLYALGVLAYELLTGRRPFEADAPAGVLAQHLQAPVTPPSAHNAEISPALEQLVVQLLSKQPQHRPSSAAAVRQALVDIIKLPSVPDAYAAGPRLDFLVRGRLVGREHEMAQAHALWREAAGGRRQVLLISGEPGIGKTRLALEICARAQVEGGLVLQGQCFENGGLPYMPVTQMIRAAFEGDRPSPALPPNVVADLARLAPEMSDQPPLGVDGGADETQDENRLLESIVALCQLLTGRRPLLLFFDDLHWADSGSLAVVRHLARRLTAMPLMILATYREIDLTGRRPARQVLDDLRREAGAQRLKLGRLDREQTEAMLATLFAEEIGPDFLEAIYQETEGNPFFVEEICKALVESGELAYDDGRWRQPALDQLRLPQSIQIAIEGRLEKLDAQLLDVLRAAAMLGREFRYDLLRDATGLSEAQLVEVLEGAIQAQLILELPTPGARKASPPTFTFAHALIQATLLEGLGVLRRRFVAKRLALVLEAASLAERESFAPLLGRLFAEAGDGEKAVPYLLAAGDEARRLFAYDEAIESYEQALLFLRDWGDLDRSARVLMIIGATSLKAGYFERSRRAYDEAFAIWHRAPQARRMAGGQGPAPTRLFRTHTNEPITLDPTRANDTSSAYINRQIFEGLVELGPDDEVIPAVASHWEILEGGRRYLFHLRNDATWSDGQQVTAADFEFAWRRLLEPLTSRSQAPIFFDICGARAFHDDGAVGQKVPGIRIANPLTLEVELEQPVAYFLHLVASESAFPVPRHVLARHGDRWAQIENIVTNGPYKPEVWETGRRIVLTRNPAWRGAGSGNIASVELNLVNDVALLEEYAADRLDCLYPAFLPRSDHELALHRFSADLVSFPSLATTYLAFNCGKPPLDDKRLRQAISRAIDRERLVYEHMEGRYAPATTGLIPPGIVGHGLGPRAMFDPQIGRQLLAEAGYPGGRGLPRLTFYEAATEGDRTSPGAWLSAQMATNLGLDIDLKQLSLHEMMARLKQDPPHMWAMGWSADYTDPDSFMRGGDWPDYCNWPNETFDRLVEDARAETGQARRLPLYRQAEEILADDVPLIPLIYQRWHLLLKPWVRRFAMSPTVWTIFKDVVLEDKA